MKSWYEDLFANYADTYDRLEFTRGTVGEVDFMVSELGENRQAAILDIGCGTGRHAIELARRGYRVTGIDLSEDQLNKAREKAKTADVAVDFVRMDARMIRYKRRFDAAVMICEGAFPLMETDEENFEILRSAARALKRNGTLILTTLNALFPLYHSIGDFINSNDSSMTSSGHRFDLLTFRDFSTITVSDDDGQVKTIDCNERYYVPSEMTWMLRSLGFQTVDILGCPMGAWDRQVPLTRDDFEMLVVARKTGRKPCRKKTIAGTAGDK